MRDLSRRQLVTGKPRQLIRPDGSPFSRRHASRGALITRRQFVAGGAALGILAALEASLERAEANIRFKQPLSSQYFIDFVGDCGAIGDGSTDNSNALIAFGNLARAASVSGQRVKLNVPPGVYNWNGANVYGFLFGISQLEIDGYGATFQNTNTGPNAWAYQAWPVACSCDHLNNAGNLVQTVTPARTSFRLVTPSNGNNINVGDYVLLASCNLQYLGIPPNLYYFEYCYVESINTSTGVVTVRDPILFPHRSDYPTIDGVNGPAAVWPLRSNAGYTWNVDHTYRGITFLQASGAPGIYNGMCGRRITYEDCTLPGASPTVADEVILKRCVLTTNNEPDKLVNIFRMVDCQSIAGLNYQSPINVAVHENCRFNQVLVGMAKIARFKSCIIESLNEGGTYGTNLDTTLDDCLVLSANSGSRFSSYNGSTITVDRTNVLYSNGLFTIPKSGGYKYLNPLSIFPGAVLVFQASGNGNTTYPGDIATGFVTKIYDDSNNVYVQTTFSFSSVPSWATGVVLINRTGRLRVNGCSGCAVIDTATVASQQGLDPWQYDRKVFGGITGTSANYTIGNQGILRSMTINVIQATSVVSSPRLVLSGYVLGLPALTTKENLVIAIDTSVVANRQLTASGFSNLHSNDRVTLGGNSITALPTDQWMIYPFSWTISGYTPSSYAPYQLPVVDVELIYGGYTSPRHGVPAWSGVAGIVGGLQ